MGMGIVRNGGGGSNGTAALPVLGRTFPAGFPLILGQRSPKDAPGSMMLFPNAEVVVNPGLLLLLGLILGTLSGFFGVGGGFLITGGMLVFGVPAPIAVGTGLTLIMGSSIINTLKHRDLGNVDFKLGLLIVSGTIPALFLAQWIITELKASGLAESAIRYAYVVVLALVGLFIIYDFWRTQKQSDRGREATSTAGFAHRVQSLRLTPESMSVPGIGRIPLYVALPVSGIARISVLVPFAVGFLAGLFAGLLGAGGGTILMPILIFAVGIPTTVAIGTDLFQILITGSVGTFIKAFSNEVDLLMVVLMLCAASLGSQLGATATRFVEASRIRFLFGVTVLSGSLAVALEQVSNTGLGPKLLADVASFLLLGTSGTICLIIVGLLITAKRRKPGGRVPQG
jgi:uncharacterized membrane protein YfcA